MDIFDGYLDGYLSATYHLDRYPFYILPRPLLATRCSLKVRLLPGTSTSVTLALRPRDFAFYDVAAEGAEGAEGAGATGAKGAKGAWCVAPGAYELRVGSSSADVRLTAMVQVGEVGEAAAAAAAAAADDTAG